MLSKLLVFIMGIVAPVNACSSVSELLDSSDNLSTLKDLVQQNNLTDVLDSGNFTVFAPTNDAFANLELPQDANVTDILLYHVLGGNYELSELVDENTLFAFNNSQTLNGQDVFFRHLFNSTYVNNALILDSDIEACNSKVNIINRVLVPSHCQNWVYYWFTW